VVVNVVVIIIIVVANRNEAAMLPIEAKVEVANLLNTPTTTLLHKSIAKLYNPINKHLQLYV
jgi:hypothetical protein